MSARSKRDESPRAAPPMQDRQRLGNARDFVSRVAPQGVHLVAPTGERVELPAAAYQVLCQILSAMADGVEVGLLPLHQELTTQQTAELLGVSRPSVVSLLDRGEIAYRKIGTHRRVRVDDVLAFQYRRRTERRAALDELTSIAEEYGDYA